MSLEEVMDLTIETSSKQKKKQFNESASTYVITQEDITRSGVTSLPEALRLAPGVHVARISANQWAISIHGFNERFSNKLLVLIDGRSVYSPLFSGVYWDAQDILLENVKRIEVVRGSGTALWGSNAVNGVINVITYSAKETQGIETTAGYGTEENGFGSLRYGGALGEKTHYRIYGKHYKRDDGGIFNQQPAHDDSSMNSGGIHIDSNLTENQSLLITGGAYDGKMGQSGNVPELSSPTFTRFINDNVRLSGENILARWTDQEYGHKNWALQAYYDHTSREDSVLGNQEVNIADLDFQRHFAWLSNQEIAWGLQYRYVNNK
ncbi:TonB-dependent receptor plug domain-containing protein, partial [Methylobacter sp.]|uniref:TonB-dependent receptor plug domain-containing protein n=1 Tax=Methylobacter sp. TaxID=2051955 RepID=UPI0025EDFAA6